MTKWRKHTQAQTAADDLVKRLRKIGDPQAKQLAKNLSRCREDDPCGSLACRLCREQVQGEFIEAAFRLWGEESFVTALTIISRNGIVEEGHLDGFDLNALVRRDRVRLKRLLPEGTEALGFVDVSLNTFDNANPHWCFHWHICVRGELGKAELRRLRSSYRHDESAGIYRAVRAEVIGTDELRSVAGYCVKGDFKRRSGFLATPRSGRNPYRDHREQSLSKREAVELALAMGNYEVLAPLMAISLKRKRVNWPLAIRLQHIGARVSG
ncbi:hypothetical protein GI374_03075 [Paracoccus sp. S-4012]|uniref:hypothetical protein n=1 Tax=Paracoccus sp. S-4012 TaxID=2665648 RepID=UPI0012B10681|nr:hypothetical protein [Paracoccus sp. S-4012]MRX49444.1 hypothetical protein [Paracoccus sp. S-4012]